MYLALLISCRNIIKYWCKNYKSQISNFNINIGICAIWNLLLGQRMQFLAYLKASSDSYTTEYSTNTFGMKFCLKLQSYFNLVIFLTDHVANISWKRNYNKNASLDFFHPMVFLIDEKLGNLALFDEISLLGITGKQKSQCTPLLQSNQCAI